LLNNNGTLRNYGTLENYAGGTINGTGTYTQDEGQTINNGSITQALLDIRGGSLSGIGTITAPVTLGSGAILAPGNSTGTMTINGDFTSSGNLFFEIAGLGPGLYDVIDINGKASFTSGTIEFDFINNYKPVIGNSWDFLFADSIERWDALRFTVNGLGFGLGWEIDDITGGERLLITQAVPEPGILILLGISMASVVGLRRWWKE